MSLDDAASALMRFFRLVEVDVREESGCVKEGGQVSFGSKFAENNTEPYQSQTELLL